MKCTHRAIARGLAKRASDGSVKTAAPRNRRWLEDSDLVKLCNLFKKRSQR